MTDLQQKQIIKYLIAAGFELGNLDGTRDWGWSGHKMAELLAEEWGLSTDKIARDTSITVESARIR